MPNFEYPGTELDVFAHAQQWKRYWSDSVTPYICGDVLEVGAGLGANTRLLSKASHRSWTCIEPDANLYARLTENLRVSLPSIECQKCTVAQCAAQYDTILYIDVLEHIENDKAELACALEHLKPGGRLIVLSPAFQVLYSDFDAAIGHFRRYNKTLLISTAPATIRLVKARYFDALGASLSMANRLMLRTKEPSLRQIRFWDSSIIPVSRYIDVLFSKYFGRSLLAVWQRDE